MFQRWNEHVRADDEVWHLGDFAVGRSRDWIESCLSQLSGRKHLVAGNNDKRRCREASGWSSVQDYAELELENRMIVLCHYPFRSWRKMDKGALNLHGHCHGKMRPLTRQCDVGVDAWSFRPVKFEEILGNVVSRQASRLAAPQC